MCNASCFQNLLLDKELVINYGEGGLQNGKIVGLKRFVPPPQDRLNFLNYPPIPFCRGKTRSITVHTSVVELGI